MSADLSMACEPFQPNVVKTFVQYNPFVGDECVLKKCCKKYKKGKRCKKCPDR